jgi:hypothetical protein
LRPIADQYSATPQAADAARGEAKQSHAHKSATINREAAARGASNDDSAATPATIFTPAE